MELQSISGESASQLSRTLVKYGDWQSWAVGAAGALFGFPYMGKETTQAAWSEVVRNIKQLHSR